MTESRMIDLPPLSPPLTVPPKILAEMNGGQSALIACLGARIIYCDDLGLDYETEGPPRRRLQSEQISAVFAMRSGLARIATARARFARRRTLARAAELGGLWSSHLTLRKSLCSSCLGLCRSACLRFGFAGDALADAEQEAFIALSAAIDHWDSRRGWSLTTYVYAIIRTRLSRWSRVSKGLKQNTPKNAEVARRESASHITGDLVASIRDPSVQGPDELARLAEVRQAVRCLPELERFVIQARFGLDSRPMTLAEIGIRLGGFSKECIRQREVKALEMLRNRLGASSITVEEPIHLA